MRTRLLASEAALADYEILEMLLFFGIERRDTKPLAKGLINQFGSLAGALTAEGDALRRAGLPPRAVEALALVGEAAATLARPEQAERIVLGSWAVLERHLDVPGRTLQPPGTSALLLNNRNQLLGEPSWPPGLEAERLGREMLRHALDRHASALIVVRNAGAGPAVIGAEDRALSGVLRRAAPALVVSLHDVLVLGQGDWVSLRQQGGL